MNQLLHQMADDRRREHLRSVVPAPAAAPARTRRTVRQRLGWSLIGVGARLARHGSGAAPGPGAKLLRLPH